MRKFLKWLRHVWKIACIHVHEFAADVQFSGFASDRAEKAKWRLLLLSHSLEKGLGLRNKRDDFGVQRACDLMKYMGIYLRCAGRKDSFEYRESSSVLQKYFQFRNERDQDNTALAAQLSRSGINLDDSELLPAGERKLTHEDVKYDAPDFYKLCFIRHSVREFSGEKVTDRQIRSAVELACMAPSACNRQAVKVYCSESPTVNRRLAELVPGNRGFENEPDKYLFIAADRCAFDDMETGQWYVNGGLFTGFLQLAFTAQQIGSCIYQWPKDSKAEGEAKKLLGISGSEIIVAVLGVGHYKSEFSVICAARRGADDVLVIK